MNQYFFIRKLNKSHTDTVKQFIYQLKKTSPVPFLAPTDETLSKCLTSHVSLGLFLKNKDKLVSCRLSYFPGLEKDNLGYLSELPKNDLEKVCQYSLLGVNYDYRGMGIGSNMHKKSLELLKKTRNKYILGSCNPKNKTSLHLFKKFEFTHNSKLYSLHGKKRYILMKKI